MKSMKLPAFERLMIFFSLLSFGLLLYQCIFTFSLHYTFFLWNLLIAFVPYVVSKQLLKCNELGMKAFLLLITWLVFFPSCVYLFTDLLQMNRSDNFSFLYNVMLFSSFAFTGLMSGLLSLRQVETFLKKHVPAFLVKISVLFFIFLSSYSICLIRFLHFRSWSVAADIRKMIHASEHNILDPENHVRIWLSILILVLLIDLLYVGLKKVFQLAKN
jgi:uncharacterized membrane protein